MSNKREIAKKICISIKKIKNDFDKDEEYVESLITTPPNLEMGDLALPCFVFAKDLRQNPKAIADAIKLNLDSEEGEKIFKEVRSASGYLNFYLDRSQDTKRVIESIVENPSAYGSIDHGKSKLCVVDYSSPNVAKPIALHHLRSTMIGNALCNLLEFAGFKVKRLNFLGDWGTNFGKLIVAFKKWGDEDSLQSDGVEYLVEIYTRFQKESESDPGLEDQAREWFKKMEDSDPEAIKIWEHFREITIEEFKRIYKRLGVKFDSYDGESSVNKYIPETISEIDTKLNLKASKGAEIIELEEENLPPVLIRKSDGATLYSTRDIAEAIRRHKEENFHKNLYVVATQQNLHFQSVFKVLSMLGHDWQKDCLHIAFGMMMLNDKKMATRTGNMITLEDVLDKSRELALEIINAKKS